VKGIIPCQLANTLVATRVEKYHIGQFVTEFEGVPHSQLTQFVCGVNKCSCVWCACRCACFVHSIGQVQRTLGLAITRQLF